MAALLGWGLQDHHIESEQRYGLIAAPTSRPTHLGATGLHARMNDLLQAAPVGLGRRQATGNADYGGCPDGRGRLSAGPGDRRL
jgi:hypothetical protein